MWRQFATRNLGKFGLGVGCAGLLAAVERDLRRECSLQSVPLCKSVSVYASQGPRAGMEDEYFVSSDNRFFGVFDGHGGAKVSRLARLNLFKILEEELQNSDSISDALMKSFAKVSTLILEDHTLDYEGSTAVTVYLEEDKIWTANLGDSRAVLCTDEGAIDITIDHKPNSETEKKRITDLGGFVAWYGYLGPDRQPVPGMGAYRINGNLAVSRAFGDSGERPFVSDVPEVQCIPRQPDKDKFIILASDGLWDVMTGKEAFRFVQQIMSGSVGALEEGRKARRPSRTLNKWMRSYSGDASMVRAVLETRKSKIAKYLVEESLRRGTSDNVTVIVVWLR